ncbi:MAG: hypothetical protein Q9208_003028 [Pyrenodesmia sp. 3 TL-2023]
MAGYSSEPSSIRNSRNNRLAQPGNAHHRIESKTDVISGSWPVVPPRQALGAAKSTQNNKSGAHQVRSGLMLPVKSSAHFVGITPRSVNTSSGRVRPPTTTSFQAPFSRYHPKSGRRKDPSDREAWQIQKDALKTKFCAEGWAPRKRLSPDALEGIRALHAQFPNKYTTPVLANQFEVSAEAIRRILKSKWRPNDEETVSRRTRWDKRGERIWSRMVALGVKPPKKWREMGVGRDDHSPAVAAELPYDGTYKGTSYIARTKRR